MRGRPCVVAVFKTLKFQWFLFWNTRAQYFMGAVRGRGMMECNSDGVTVCWHVVVTQARMTYSVSPVCFVLCRAAEWEPLSCLSHLYAVILFTFCSSWYYKRKMNSCFQVCDTRFYVHSHSRKKRL
jgi:hypothetical protein